MVFLSELSDILGMSLVEISAPWLPARGFSLSCGLIAIPLYEVVVTGFVCGGFVLLRRLPLDGWPAVMLVNYLAAHYLRYAANLLIGQGLDLANFTGNDFFKSSCAIIAFQCL